MTDREIIQTAITYHETMMEFAADEMVREYVSLSPETTATLRALAAKAHAEHSAQIDSLRALLAQVEAGTVVLAR